LHEQTSRLKVVGGYLQNGHQCSMAGHSVDMARSLAG